MRLIPRGLSYTVRPSSLYPGTPARQELTAACKAWNRVVLAARAAVETLLNPDVHYSVAVVEHSVFENPKLDFQTDLDVLRYTFLFIIVGWQHFFLSPMVCTPFQFLLPFLIGQAAVNEPDVCVLQLAFCLS